MCFVFHWIIPFFTLQRPQKLVHFSQVQFWVSHTRKTDSTLAANTFWLSGDHRTWFSPPPFARLTRVATPMGMSHVIRLLSAGEAETRKLPWGLQESDVMGVWPGEVSTRTQLVRNLRERERERGRKRGWEREGVRERESCWADKF